MRKKCKWYKSVLKSFRGKKDRHIEMQFFDPIWKKTGAKIPNNLTSYFSFARSRFLSRSTIWMPEIAYIHLAHTDRYSLYKRTSYLSETGPECIRRWDFDCLWTIRVWCHAGVNYCKPVALNSVTCDLVGETKLFLLLGAFPAYLLNLWQFNILPMC